MVARLTTDDENWEVAVCPESTCAAVVTRRQARERAGGGVDADQLSDSLVSDPPLQGGRADDPPCPEEPASEPRPRLSLTLAEYRLFRHLLSSGINQKGRQIK